MSHSHRKNVIARLQRFQISAPVSVIVKNVRSRCTCFWFNLTNVSATGVGLSYQGNGYIPFFEGDELHLTVDLSCVIFSRPIHLTVIIRRRGEKIVESNDAGGSVTEIFLGGEIKDSEALHRSVWLEGLSTLGDPLKVVTITESRGKEA